MQPPCRVIVLESNPHSVSAYGRLCASLTAHGYQWQPFAAVRGDRVSADTWQQLGVNLLTDRGKLWARPGAQGCWISHYTLWQQCRDSGQSMIILEEDALAQAQWDTAITACSAVVKLHEWRGQKVNSITGQWGPGAFAYWLTAESADQLIQHAQQHGAQALDKHLGRSVVEWQHWPQPLFRLGSRTGGSTTSPVKINIRKGS